MYPHHPSHITHERSRAHLTSYLPTVYNPHKYSCLLSVFNLNLKMAIVKAETCSWSLCSKFYIFILVYAITQLFLRPPRIGPTFQRAQSIVTMENRCQVQSISAVYLTTQQA